MLLGESQTYHQKQLHLSLRFYFQGVKVHLKRHFYPYAIQTIEVRFVKLTFKHSTKLQNFKDTFFSLYEKGGLHNQLQ